MGKRGKGRLPHRSMWERYLQCPVCHAFPGLPCHGKENASPCRYRAILPPDLCEKFPVDSYVRMRISPDIGVVVAHVKRNCLRIRWRNGHETEIDILPTTNMLKGPSVERATPDAVTRLAFLSGDQPV